MASHLSFAIQRSQLQQRILIPKYYDPELEVAADFASRDFDLPRLGELLEAGAAGSKLGSWIPREYYGSGPIPFVRTSDFNSWRIRPDYKKGVSQAVFATVSARQGVRPNDILMVAHGTYLIGAVALVTESDLPLVLQDHVFRLRVSKDAGVHPLLLLAALSTKFVRRQIRSKQFSADIIDKIGDRHLEVKVPLPKSAIVRSKIVEEIRLIIDRQTHARAEVERLLGTNLGMSRERAVARYDFQVPRHSIRNRILIPKYYDPLLTGDLKLEERRTKTRWVTIQSLVDAGMLAVGTGVEVGKMAYGTGPIPFVRTTDIADLHLKWDPRQGISQAIYDRYSKKAAVKEGDVIVVRDGTYLVGSSAIVTKSDEPALICGGIYRLRCSNSTALHSHKLLGLLNLPLVRRQLRSKQFTREVIDTLGKRLFEVLVPDPSSEFANSIESRIGHVIQSRIEIAKKQRDTIILAEPIVPDSLSGRPGWSMRA